MKQVTLYRYYDKRLDEPCFRMRGQHHGLCARGMEEAFEIKLSRRPLVLKVVPGIFDRRDRQWLVFTHASLLSETFDVYVERSPCSHDPEIEDPSFWSLRSFWQAHVPHMRCEMIFRALGIFMTRPWFGYLELWQ
jgi:hypothetical protein